MNKNGPNGRQIEPIVLSVFGQACGSSWQAPHAMSYTQYIAKTAGKNGATKQAPSQSSRFARFIPCLGVPYNMLLEDVQVPFCGTFANQAASRLDC